MGSFNATCSLSDLTISCGDECLLFPLLPATYDVDKRGYIRIEPSSMYVSNEGAYMFFAPMSFPIRGQYNDYGSIEDIIEDENTKAIENYFGMTIEQFVSIITDGRKGMDDSYSDTFQVFAINKKLFEYNTHLDEKFLLSIGFEIIDEKEKEYRHPHVLGSIVKLVPLKQNKNNLHKKPSTYQIIEEKSGTIKKTTKDSYDVEKRFINDFLDVTGYYLNITKENQIKAKILLATSGMFILQEVYDLYTKEKVSKTFGSEKSLESKVVEAMGFKLRCEDKTIERYHKVYEFPGVTDYVLNSDGTWSHIVKTSKAKPNTGKQEEWIYHPNDLIITWKKLTGIDLPITKKFLNKSEYEFNFDVLVEELNVKSEDKVELEGMLEESYALNKKTLSDAETFETRFNESIESIKKNAEATKKYKAEKALEQDEEDECLFEDEDDEEYEDDDDFDFRSMNLQMKELNEKMERMEKENETLLSDSISIDEKKSIFRKRIEESVKMHENRNVDDDSILSRLDRVLSADKLRMKFPIPHHCFQRFEFIDKIYKSQIKDKSIKSYFVDFCHFYWGMYTNHRFFAPAQYGSQEDNSGARKILAEKIIDIANSRKREYEEA